MKQSPFFSILVMANTVPLTSQKRLDFPRFCWALTSKKGELQTPPAIFTCSEMSKLVQSTSMKVLCSLKTLMCLVAPFTILWHFRNKKHRLVIHPNAKLIYECHLLLALLASFFYAFQYVVDTYRFFTSSTYCDLLLNTSLSYPILLLSITMDYAQGCLFLSLAVERVIASVYHNAYESIATRSLAVVLIFVSILFSFMSTSTLLLGVAWERPTMAFTSASTQDGQMLMIMGYVHTGVELLAIVIFHFVLCLNKRHSHARYNNSLGSNYQKSENRRVTITMLPIFYVHFFIFVAANFSVGLYMEFVQHESPAAYAIFTEYTVWTPLYPAIAPLLPPLADRWRRRIQEKGREEQVKNVFIPMEVLFGRKPITTSF